MKTNNCRTANTWLLCLLGCICLTAEADKLQMGDSTVIRVLYLYGSVDEDGGDPFLTGKPPFHQMRLDDRHDQRRGLSQFRNALEDPDEPILQEAGVVFQLEERLDREVVLTPMFLGRYDVLILGSNNRRFTTESDTSNDGNSESQAVADWVQGGGGLIAWSDSAFGGHFAKVGVGNPKGRLSNNDLTTQFGMFFMRDNGAGNYLITEYEEDHYLNGYDAGASDSENGPEHGVAYRGEGVSPVRVTEPARMLARLQHSGLGGEIRLHTLDAQDPAIGPYQPDIDAALAIAEIGQGRVLGTFDRNTFWNAGEGTRLSHADNRVFAQRMLVWVAGKEPALAAALDDKV